MKRYQKLKPSNGMSARIPNKTRREVYRRDGYRCALCDDTRTIQIHHAIPRAAGGSDFPDNLITLCDRCHAAAHGVLMPEMPKHCTKTYMDEAICEYLADYYVEHTDMPWYPYK